MANILVEFLKQVAGQDSYFGKDSVGSQLTAIEGSMNSIADQIQRLQEEEHQLHLDNSISGGFSNRSIDPARSAQIHRQIYELTQKGQSEARAHARVRGSEESALPFDGRGTPTPKQIVEMKIAGEKNKGCGRKIRFTEFDENFTDDFLR